MVLLRGVENEGAVGIQYGGCRDKRVKLAQSSIGDKLQSTVHIT